MRDDIFPCSHYVPPVVYSRWTEYNPCKAFEVKAAPLEWHVQVDVFASPFYVYVCVFFPWVVVPLWWLVWELELVRDFSHRALPAAHPRLHLTRDQSFTNHSPAPRWGFLCFLPQSKFTSERAGLHTVHRLLKDITYLYYNLNKCWHFEPQIHTWLHITSESGQKIVSIGKKMNRGLCLWENSRHHSIAEWGL